MPVYRRMLFGVLRHGRIRRARPVRTCGGRLREQWRFRSVSWRHDVSAAVAVFAHGVVTGLRSRPLISTLDTYPGNAMVKNWQTALSRVRAALMRRGRTRHDADDLVQEAWVRLACYERRETVAEPEAFLMRAALNLSIDAYRANRNHGEQVLLEDAVLVDTTPDAEAILLGRERIARLSECLACLDPKTRKIFLAHRLDGLSYLVIARDNRVSVSSVEKHIAKAILVLSSSMEGW